MQNLSDMTSYGLLPEFADSYGNQLQQSLFSSSDFNFNWQSLLSQEQQRQQLSQMSHQSHNILPPFSSTLASFYQFSNPIVPQRSAQQFGSIRTSLSKKMRTASNPLAEVSVMKDCNITDGIENARNEKIAFTPLCELSFKTDSPRSVSNIGDNMGQFMFSSSSDQYGSTSCEESDGGEFHCNYENPSKLDVSKASAENNSEECDTLDKLSDQENGGRKRKQYWRQGWYKERNKEYSRNWRSKKKMEEESLRSEIRVLRAYKELMEETLETHFHNKDKPGFPFTYASPSFQRLVGADSGSMIEKDLTSFIHESDRSKLNEALNNLKDPSDVIDVAYRFRVSKDQDYIQLKSSVRLCSKGFMMVTLKV